MPNIKCCNSCSSKENITHFSIRDDGFKCEACSRQDTGAIKISPATIDAMRYIFTVDPKKIFSFKVSEESEKELEITKNNEEITKTIGRTEEKIPINQYKGIEKEYNEKKH